MQVDESKCVGCGNCVPICTMGVISVKNRRAQINQDECVECGTCRRVLHSEGFNPGLVRFIRRVISAFHLSYDAPVDVCPTGALVLPELEWPRIARRVFSDPTVKHPGTGVGGRGTEEIKTNDVTGRLGEGDVGFCVELGRPGLGARFHQIEKIAMALSRAGVRFEPNNPVTQLMSDPQTGKVKEEMLQEKVLSAIIEFKVKMEQVSEVLRAIHEAQAEVDTVMSVAIASRCRPDGSIPHEETVRALGYKLSLNGKTNLGLGKRTAKGVAS